MSVEEYLNGPLTDDWKVTHLIKLETDWQVICTDEVHVVTATGPIIEVAIAYAKTKIDNGQYTGQLFHVRDHMADETPIPLLARLGLSKPKQPFNRRV